MSQACNITYESCETFFLQAHSHRVASLLLPAFRLTHAGRYTTAFQREGAIPALLRSRSSGRLGTS